jgi:aldehyde:ferredoxin oxidoreductase
MVLCRFLRGVFEEPFEEWARLLSLVTGWDVTAGELRATAQRIVLAKRAYNLREGWQPEDDWLPERFLSEGLAVGSGRTAALTPATLRSMIDGYYAARGLDASGRPPG